MDSKTLQTLRRDAEDICRSAIEASVPDAAIQRALAQLPPCQGRTVLVSIGKAGWQTAKAAYDALGSAIEQGVVVTKYGHSQGPIGGLAIYEAGHPVPDENSVRATEAALAAVSRSRAVGFKGAPPSLFQKGVQHAAALPPAFRKGEVSRAGQHHQPGVGNRFFHPPAVLQRGGGILLPPDQQGGRLYPRQTAGEILVHQPHHRLAHNGGGAAVIGGALFGPQLLYRIGKQPANARQGKDPLARLIRIHPGVIAGAVPRLEPRGVYQHNFLHLQGTLRPIHQLEDNPAAVGMPHQHRLPDMQRLGKSQDKIHIIVHAPGRVRLVAAAEAGQIGGDHAAIGGEMVDDQPVGFRRSAPAMEQQHHRAGSLIDICHTLSVDDAFHTDAPLHPESA